MSLLKRGEQCCIKAIKTTATKCVLRERRCWPSLYLEKRMDWARRISTMFWGSGPSFTLDLLHRNSYALFTCSNISCRTQRKHRKLVSQLNNNCCCVVQQCQKEERLWLHRRTASCSAGTCSCSGNRKGTTCTCQSSLFKIPTDLKTFKWKY